mmetsp:Transcript_19442/g.66092  ORF Transcript_19442/g.66092 Transcript_19442/m.66092 type:complete len:251 (-) Transcript_19442:421-1173(-)
MTAVLLPPFERLRERLLRVGCVVPADGEGKPAFLLLAPGCCAAGLCEVLLLGADGLSSTPIIVNAVAALAPLSSAASAPANASRLASFARCCGSSATAPLSSERAASASTCCIFFRSERLRRAADSASSAAAAGGPRRGDWDPSSSPKILIPWKPWSHAPGTDSKPSVTPPAAVVDVGQWHDSNTSASSFSSVDREAADGRLRHPPAAPAPIFSCSSRSRRMYDGVSMSSEQPTVVARSMSQFPKTTCWQ